MSSDEILPVRGRINVSDLNEGHYRPDRDTLDAVEDAIERLVWRRFGLSVDVWFYDEGDEEFRIPVKDDESTSKEEVGE